jgi:hypothetical protein
MNDFGDLQRPDFNEYSLENWGYVLRDSAALNPDTFPYKVGISKNSTFYHSVYDDVYKGRGTTVSGSADKIRPSGIWVEHEAILGVNDLGGLMISKEVFEGDTSFSRTPTSDVEYKKHVNLLRSIPMPPGWRSFGTIHSHPVDDVGNELIAKLNRNIPQVDGVSLTWSGGDFNSFIQSAGCGFRGFTTLGLINTNLLSFMVASKQTVEQLHHEALNKISVPDQGIPPYKKFSDLGIILYAGVHNSMRNDKVSLERLI